MLGQGQQKARERRILDFASMFSDHPRYTVKLDPAVPQPTYTDHQGRGRQRKEALQQLAGPLVPTAQQIPPSVTFALPKGDFVTTDGSSAEQQPTHFTVGVQTDYRESETQTDPYCPEYVIYPGTTPSELLQLAVLTWGRGLPAGLAEVEKIERARAKQAWEASLPPLDDQSQLNKRWRMMKEMEAKEWAFRESEIEKLQEARLAVLKDLLKQKDEARKDITNQRLNQIYSKLQKDKDCRLQKIQTDYNRSLRKLKAKRKNAEEKLKRCAIASKTYVPRIHRDILPIKNIDNMHLTSYYSDTYEGLQGLEAQINASIFKPQMKGAKPKVITDVIKPPVDRVVQLLEKYKALRVKDKQVVEKSLRFLVKTKKPVHRPATPTVKKPPEGEEEKELAVIYLQKLLRGRRIQYEMTKGTENHQELIQELRTVHSLRQEEQELHKADRELVVMLKKQRDKHREKLFEREASQVRVVGAELEEVFDTLSKELIHLQEERRIHAYTLLAERERRLREAEESGRRQVEDRRRREEDEIFRQVVQVHQETVDLYLEDLVLDSIEHIADQQAREEIHRTAQEVNDIAYATEESQDNLKSEEIVPELVYGFLIPEVEKIGFRQRVHQMQHRHLQAARKIIQGTANPSESLNTTLEAPKFICPGIKSSSRVLEETTSQVERGKGAVQYDPQTE